VTPAYALSLLQEAKRLCEMVEKGDLESLRKSVTKENVDLQHGE
jgi:hypothetical protein